MVSFLDPVLVLDAQATSSSPTRGEVLELGWARTGAAPGPELTSEGVTACVVLPPVARTVPPGVSRVTGLTDRDLDGALDPSLAFDRLVRAAGAIAPSPVPAVVHFARFEEGLLRGLHERHGAGAPFPFLFVCTHALARRLLPDLPRCTLRAVAGYLGQDVPLLRRATEHVVATAFVWRRLATLVAGREGISTFDELAAWLARAAPPRGRAFPMPRERRLAVPDGPGVYRFRRSTGHVLYVGKATSLRRRVNGHFQKRRGLSERALEMLSQARDLDVTETPTALEAALLEADEIKRLAPPYNVALADSDGQRSGRATWFADRDLRSATPGPDASHVVGPLPSEAVATALGALGDVLARSDPGTVSGGERARVLGAPVERAPPPDCFSEGLAHFVVAHGVDARAGVPSLLGLGARLWRERLAAAALAGSGSEESVSDELPSDESATGDSPADERAEREWSGPRVAARLEETVLRAAHVVRRARWFSRLCESVVSWVEPGESGAAVHAVVLERGLVTVRRELAAGAEAPIPPGHARSAAERRDAFGPPAGPATYDRLRVLTTELRRVVGAGGRASVSLGPGAVLGPRRLGLLLKWL